MDNLLRSAIIFIALALVVVILTICSLLVSSVVQNSITFDESGQPVTSVVGIIK